MASGGGGGKGAKEEGMFDRLKKTFEEEVNKVTDSSTVCSGVEKVEYH